MDSEYDCVFKVNFVVKKVFKNLINKKFFV